jgi:hypothetical protein
MRWAEDLTGRVFALHGAVGFWPAYLGKDPVEAVRERGAVVARRLDHEVDYLLVGSQRGAATPRQRAAVLERSKTLAQSGAKLSVLDDADFLHLLRPELAGTRFFFAGEFGMVEAGSPRTHPETLVRARGATAVNKLDETVDVAVFGDRRGEGRAAAMRRATALQRAEGSRLLVLTEAEFFLLLRAQEKPEPGTRFSRFLRAIDGMVDPKRVQRALDMLQQESFTLHWEATRERLLGIVRSQTTDGVYSTALTAKGSYACCAQDLEDCKGLQGKVCKHALVLVFGLVQSGEVDPYTMVDWLRLAARRPPQQAPNTLANTLLRYKLASEGTIDWRPTETLPEDYYGY